MGRDMKIQDFIIICSISATAIMAWNDKTVWPFVVISIVAFLDR